eukprot:1153561-Pleurochrysis_carterae.AAC.3
MQARGTITAKAIESAQADEYIDEMREIAWMSPPLGEDMECMIPAVTAAVTMTTFATSETMGHV